VVSLSSLEFNLLSLLADEPGVVFSKPDLLARLWDPGATDPNLVEACVSSLRRKIEVHGSRLIFTKRGSGYFMRPVSRSALYASA
jgi:DNA-binding response OmpR family regulator